LTQNGFSQPENLDDLPKKIQEYLITNFKNYSFSKDLLENERRTQKNELTQRF